MTRKYNNSNRLKIHRQGLILSLTIGLLLGSIGAANAALSAVTAKTIEGTPPYFTLNGIPLTNTNELVGFTWPDNTQASGYGHADYTNSIQANSSNVVTVPTGTKETDIIAGVAITGTAVLFDTLVKTTNPLQVADTDGDASTIANNGATGAMTVVLKKNGVAITPSNALIDGCNIYTLDVTVTATGAPASISAKTEYGAPAVSATGTYNATTATYNIIGNNTPSVCYAKPSITYGNSTYAGPVSEWNEMEGFLPQISPKDNFPTTGADNLYFSLIIRGVDATTLKWPGVSTTPALVVGGVTVKVSIISSREVKINLNGPTASAEAYGATAAAFTPSVFEIKGINSANVTQISYKFALKKWYISTKGYRDQWDSVLATWCTRLNTSRPYHITKVSELTNSSGTAGGFGGIMPSVTNPSTGNYYQRRIGGGLLSEWGYIPHYNAAGFYATDHYTADHYTPGTFNYTFAVNLSNGYTSTVNYRTLRRAICVSP